MWLSTKKYICGAWSLELLGTPDLLKQIGYGGYGGYLYFQEKKKKKCGAWLLESLDTPDHLKHSGYGGYRGYHGYRGYQEKLFWRSLVI